VRFVGERTFGSSGQPLPIRLPGGGWARVCAKRDSYPDGREFVGYGITPDVEVTLSVEDVRAGGDKVLARGVAVIEQEISAFYKE
jgi:C-terminal processing protease CtpA/Prc